MASEEQQMILEEVQADIIKSLGASENEIAERSAATKAAYAAAVEKYQEKYAKDFAAMGKDSPQAKRYKGLAKGQVLDTIRKLGPCSCRTIGEYLDLPPQMQETGALYHLRALAGEGTLVREIDDRQTLYHLKHSTT